MKTTNDIERDFYTIISESTLGTSINGEVYRTNMRPSVTDTEDIVVSHLSGVLSQIQTGVVLVNIYTISAIDSNERSVDDKARIGELQTMFFDFIDSYDSPSGYVLEADGMPRTEYDKEAKRWVLSCRVRYRYLNI